MAWPRIRAMDCSQRPIFKAFVIAGGPKVPNSAKNWTVMGVKLRCISDVSNADHVRSSPDSRHFQSQSACLKGAMCGRLRVGKRNLHVAGLVGAAMCSAFRCGSHDRWP
jgi:hypothetical protein